MAEYIERDAVLAMKKPFPTSKDSVTLYQQYFISPSAVEKIPAADVVPVVRCRDCKHRDPEDRKCDCGGLEHAHMFPVSDDWFCADGEKWEVEHD